MTILDEIIFDKTGLDPEERQDLGRYTPKDPIKKAERLVTIATIKSLMRNHKRKEKALAEEEVEQRNKQRAEEMERFKKEAKELQAKRERKAKTEEEEKKQRHKKVIWVITAANALPEYADEFEDVNVQQEWISRYYHRIDDVREHINEIEKIPPELKKINKMLHNLNLIKYMDKVIVAGSAFHSEIIADIRQKLANSECESDSEKYKADLETLGYVSNSLWDTAPTEQPFLIDGILPYGAGEIFGFRGHGKTFAILDMLFCIAHGIDWHGHKVEQGKVVYMAGEGHNDLKSRLMALSEHYDVPIDQEQFILPDYVPNLMKEDDVKALATQIGDGNAIIVFDTLISFAEGIDMNGSIHWSIIFANLKKHIRPLVKTMAWVTHTNNANATQPTGTKQRINDSDFSIHIQSKKKDSYTFKIGKAKGWEKKSDIKFALKKVANSLVPVLDVPVKLNKTDKAVMEIIGKSTATHDEVNAAVEAVYNPDNEKTPAQVRNQRRKIKDRLETVLEITE